MDYTDHQLVRRLSAEYVAGGLRRGARRRFERILARSATAQAHVVFWEQHFGTLEAGQPAVEPPADVRASLMRAILVAGPPSPLPALLPKSLPARRARWLRPYVMGFASAAALLLAAGVALHDPRVRGAWGRSSTTDFSEGADVPIYAARVGIPDSSVQWLVSVSPDHQKLDVVAGDDFLQAGRNRVQLWCAIPGGTPIPLGTLPVNRYATASFAIPVTLRRQPEVSFLISLEPMAPGMTRPLPGEEILNAASALDGI